VFALSAIRVSEHRGGAAGAGREKGERKRGREEERKRGREEERQKGRERKRGRERERGSREERRKREGREKFPNSSVKNRDLNKIDL